MTLSAVSAVLLVTVGSASFVQTASFAGSLVQPGTTGRLRDVQLLVLPSVRRLFDALARQRLSTDEGERVAAWADFSLLVEAVVGEGRVGPLAFDDLAAATATAHGPHVLTTPGVSTRDRVAYQLLALGYSARETADVVSGRITKQALDTAQKMLMVGRGRDAAANYLDSQYTRLMALKKPLRAQPEEPRGVSPNPFEAAIEKYAGIYDVDSAIVRAIIVVESAFNPAARSQAGAVGLMQLMPGTARALGVDPLMPEQNIEGGVRYLSELLKMFGGIELALVAYNGGPGFARRYARGETVLYGETRDYLNRVLARVQAPR